ncbi:MAG: lactonase family protein [Rhodobacteraceae bacterium]|nr:lactonase family protein [Paracoccaceae bacterium]
MLCVYIRRFAWIATLALCAPAFASAQDAGSDAGFVYVGSRTSKERNARGNGIEVFRTSQDGAWTHSETIGNLVNPSFLITNSDGTLLFTVHGDQEEASSFRIDAETGSLVKLSTSNLQGANPVHLALDKSESHLIVANYKSGSVVSLPVNDDGTLGTVISKVDLPGEPGPHREEQPSSHPHQVLRDPSGLNFIVPDKGLDRVFVLTIDDDGKLKIVSEVASREGAGPRHAAFGVDGKTVYVINELDSTITGYTYTNLELSPFQIVSTLPDDFTGNSRAAAIDVSEDGHYLYGTNRGHDSVVRFAIDQATGRLSDPQWVASGGERPRFMTIAPAGDAVLVANELTDSIYRFGISPADGKLDQGRLIAETGSPVSITFGSRP